MSTGAGSGAERASGFTGLLVALLVVSIIVAVVDFILLSINADRDAQASALVTRIQVLSQQLSRQSNDAAGGNLDAFASLKHTRDTISDLFTRLKNGDARTGMTGYANLPTLKNDFAELDQAWTQLSGDAGKVLDSQEQVLSTAASTDDFNRKTAVLNSRMDEVVKILIERGAPASQVVTASRQMLYADRMQRRAQAIVAGGEDSPSAAAGLQRDSQFYGVVLGGLINGNGDLNIRAIDGASAREILNDINKQWIDLAPSVTKLLEAAPILQTVKQAADKASIDSQTLLFKADPLSEHIAALDRTRPFPSPNLWIGLAAAVVAIFLVLFLALKLFRDQRTRLSSSAELNKRNEAAIQRLLDEMGSLADGDLTVKATVTEDFTGTIADAVNYAIDALRSLVTTINETSVQVSAAANETQATALHLSDAAEHQARQITSASSAVNEIAGSARDVSKNSADIADVAQSSVRIAGRGASIVRQTIAGMDSIREQIQDTSKRIKRLGESSQEIGTIVELINDLAEQTNILALNAAIQAASAGEAGRGFAVVADEVQRLAERASAATRRIETLVSAIQVDTNEAVASMEQTTSEVVSGAKLAEQAGTQLGEIESVSGNLAAQIKNIAITAQRQSAEVASVSQTMNVISDITAQTASGASHTAESIGNLAQLSADLRRSVADFKLPD
ncbi:MAG: methyl-accepting chemotaxis protein [Rudaea sp.]|uniref:methyl-accepting chemotaxis protein n=1 Tax=unclassified Rudaea TaxID=2627037 RepID=UPI0010F65BA8|nr:MULTISPECIES: methyl-accepting chemotaxis protein [unclassified Rudaea]MBN8888309.1 methyl-accepting chemotaxis protein [Rudaea sp.]MBR0344824.1 methyl-accepting chemotaxis protein [Rudaea sp.]